MEKWLFWGLIELSTIAFVISGYFFWRWWQLRHPSTASNDTSTPSSSQTNTDKDTPPQLLLSILDKQIQFALDRLELIRTLEDRYDERNKFKLWGTLLKVQKNILINEKITDPLPIIKQFLMSLLNSFRKNNLDEHQIKKINLKIRDIESQIKQIVESLEIKENVLLKQKSIQEDISENLNKNNRINLNKNNRINLNINNKKIELEKLKKTLISYRKKVNELKSLLKNNEITPNIFSEDTSRPHKNEERNESLNQNLQQLTTLSKRQQTVIDQLKNEIKSSKNKNNTSNTKEAQNIALTRLIRLAKESDSIIIQLESEVASTTFSIESLQYEVSERDKKLLELNEKIKNSQTTAILSLEGIHNDQKETFKQFRQNINNAPKDEIDKKSLQQQTHEIGKLEQLLKESEMCVQLLAQELEASQENNHNLQKKVDELEYQFQMISNFSSNTNQEHKQSLPELTQQHDQLKLELSTLRDDLIEALTNTKGNNDRSAYSQKNIELDRLQLAYSDLERKYINLITEKGSNHTV